MHTRSENINSHFFEGFYKEIWKHIFPEKTTIAEVDFIIEDSKLQKDGTVLDIMCGHGRHSIELARRGIQTTSVDNLPEYINEIKDIARKENLTVDAKIEDVLEMKLDQNYQAVICMGNSLQFFNKEDLMDLLNNISKHLISGGKFYINSWSIAEIVYKNNKDKTWSRVGDILILTDSRFLLQPARMEVNSIMIKDSGEREEKSGIDYIYSLNELKELLNEVGLKINTVYSIPGKKQFTLGEPRAYIVAEKIS